MATISGLSLEQVNLEVEKLGSLIRSLSTQIASVRARVTDLEQWDVTIEAAGKYKKRGSMRKGKAKAKGKGKAKGKNYGNRRN